MPMTECGNCGYHNDVPADLSVESMRASMRRAWLITFACLLLTFINSMISYFNRPAPEIKMPYEATGPGIVRFYSERTLIHENHLGYMKMLEPTCSTNLPVWNHMQANILFKWVPDKPFKVGVGPAFGQQCYEIISVQQIGPDAK